MMPTSYQYITAGPVLLEKTGSTFTYIAQDGEASVTEELTSAGTVQGAKLYKPYGMLSYSTGSTPTDLEYTGQVLDSSGLLYYHARYYDRVVGQFTSGDFVQGPNRYAYVGGNPETLTDPTGHWGLGDVFSAVVNVVKTAAPVVMAVADATLGVSSMINDVKTLADPNTSWSAKLLSVGDLALNVVMDVDMVTGTGEAARAAYVGLKVAVHGAVDVAEHLAVNEAEHVAVGEAEHVVEGDTEHAVAGLCGNSFAAATRVAVVGGTQAIATLKVGDKVTAYNPQTGKPEAKTVQHVFVNTDNNLLDVTIAPIQAKPVATTDTTKHAAADVKAHGSQAPPVAETLHTTTEHPFLTTDRGFVNAEDLRIGEQVRQLDGSVGVVVSLHHIFGIAVRYNLTVADDHTYAVGTDQWVVHNCNDPLYRGDVRSPDEIRDAGGFQPKGNNTDLKAHALDESPDSAFVATTNDRDLAQGMAETAGFQQGRSTVYVYQIERSAITAPIRDVVQELGSDFLNAGEGEFAVQGNISSEAITGHWPIDTMTGRLGEFVHW